jgi:hypothetical protein
VAVARSLDDGATWSAPVTVAGCTGPEQEEPWIATNGSGDWIVAWTEGTVDGAGGIVGARSSDGAASWSAPAGVSPGCRFNVRSSGPPVVRVRTNGGWLASWLADVGGHLDIDMVVARTNVPCSSDTDCQACEACSGSGECALGPRPGCRGATAPGKGILRLNDRENADKDSLIWKLAKGEATSVGDFGDPTTTDAYAFCLFDESAAPTDLLFAADIAASGLCGSSPCWRGTAMGYKYRDGFGSSSDGIRSVQLRAGSEGRAKVSLKGGGEKLQERLLGLPLLPLPTPLRAQLQASNGACWESAFSTTKRNDAGSFKASAD